MRRLSSLKLRTSVILLLVSTILVTLAIVGTGIVTVMIGRIDAESRVRVTAGAADIASRVEFFLANIQARVELAATAYRLGSDQTLRAILDSARQPPLTAIYIIGPDGRLVAASIAEASDQRTRELAGIDLADYPFFRATLERGQAIWSDQHLSAVTGIVTLGLAAPVGDGGVVIAELPLASLLDISRSARDSRRPRLLGGRPQRRDRRRHRNAEQRAPEPLHPPADGRRPHRHAATGPGRPSATSPITSRRRTRTPSAGCSSAASRRASRTLTSRR